MRYFAAILLSSLFSVINCTTYYATTTEIIYVIGPVAGTSTVFPSVVIKTSISQASSDSAFSVTNIGSYSPLSNSTSELSVQEAAVTIPSVFVSAYSGPSIFIDETVSTQTESNSLDSSSTSIVYSTNAQITSSSSSSSSFTSSQATISQASQKPTTSPIYSDIDSYTGTYSLNQSFATTILDIHNTKRSLHQTTDELSWSSVLFEYAATYASKYDCSGNLVHSGGQYGENLAIGYSTQDSVEAWYAEGNSYNYTSADILDHFTAVIWKSTGQVGCASKYCGEVWGDYVICNYNSAGNIVGYEKENVMPLIAA